MEKINEYVSLLKGTKLIGGSDDDKIRTALEYAFSLIGVPYRWYIEGPFKEEDQFWVSNNPAPTAKEIFQEDKCVVCAGLTNLMRRKIGKHVPGIDPIREGFVDDYNSETDEGYNPEQAKKWPGTTGTWFHYLRQKGWIDDLDLDKEYPVGTLLLRDFLSLDDQGHVAVIAGHGLTKKLRDSIVIHAFAGYRNSGEVLAKRDGKTNVGETGLSPFIHFLNPEWWPLHPKHNTGTYYTHISLPEHWLLDK